MSFPRASSSPRWTTLTLSAIERGTTATKKSPYTKSPILGYDTHTHHMILFIMWFIIYYDHRLWYSCVLFLDEIKHYSQQSTCIFTHPECYRHFHIQLYCGIEHGAYLAEKGTWKLGVNMCCGMRVTHSWQNWGLLPVWDTPLHHARQCVLCLHGVDTAWTHQHHPATNALQPDKPGLGVQGDRNVGVGLASVIISAQWWSYGGIYFQSMQNKWGGFICHVMLGYKKQNKGRNFIMLRNIPVSLETKYTLSSVTIKQMPGKYRKQSITAPGCSKSHADGNAHMAWTGANTKSLGAPQSIQQK